MSKKCHVEKDTCIGCGMCTAICADGFAFGDDGKAEFTVGEDVPEELEAGVDEAAASCPVQAIVVED